VSPDKKVFVDKVNAVKFIGNSLPSPFIPPTIFKFVNDWGRFEKEPMI
jgi:hypothetical protein